MSDQDDELRERLRPWALAPEDIITLPGKPGLGSSPFGPHDRWSLWDGDQS